MIKTIAEYSEYKKISKQAVYQKIKSGKLKVFEEAGIKYIDFDEQTDIEVENKDVELLQEKIKNLEEMLKMERDAKEKAEQREKEAITRAEKDKETFNHNLQVAHNLVAREQKNINILSENIKQLEYKQEETEKELTKEKSKSWWQKLLKK